jgi:hypothetical protein
MIQTSLQDKFCVGMFIALNLLHETLNFFLSEILTVSCDIFNVTLT